MRLDIDISIFFFFFLIIICIFKQRGGFLCALFPLFFNFVFLSFFVMHVNMCIVTFDCDL